MTDRDDTDLHAPDGAAGDGGATLRRPIFRYDRREQGRHVAGGTSSLVRWPDRALFGYPDADGHDGNEGEDEDERGGAGLGGSDPGAGAGGSAGPGAWFPVVDDALGDETEWSGEYPRLSGAPAAFVESDPTRLRSGVLVADPGGQQATVSSQSPQRTRNTTSSPGESV